MRTNLLVACVCGLAGATLIAMTAIASAQQPGAPTLVLPTPAPPATRAPDVPLRDPVAAPAASLPADVRPAAPYPSPSAPPPFGAAPTPLMPGGVPYSPEPPTVRRVITLKSVPANDLAQTLTAAFKTSQPGGPYMPGALAATRPAIITDAVSNSLVVCASRGEMEEIVRLVEMLDQPPSLVYVEVVLARMARPKAAATILVLPTAQPSGTAPKPPAVKPEAPVTKPVEAKPMPAERPAAVVTPAEKPPAVDRATAPRAVVVPPDSPPPVRRENPYAPRPGERPAYPVDRYASPAGAAPQRMADVLARLQSDPNVVAFYHVQLATLHNQPAYAQFGRREPRVVGSQVSSFGTMRNVNLENVGQLVRLTPRVSPDGAVTMEIDIESSDVARETEGVVVSESSRDGQQTRVQPVQTSMLQTTVAVREGQVVAVGGMNARRGDGTEQIVCYVTARAVRVGEGVRMPDGQRRGMPRRSSADQPTEQFTVPDVPRRPEGRGRTESTLRRDPSTRSGRSAPPEAIPPAEPVRPPR